MELAARIGTMARRGAPLPYDAEVEYIEASNQPLHNADTNNAAWIDTLYVPTSSTKMICRMALTTQRTDTAEQLFGVSATGRFAWGCANVPPTTMFYVGLGGQNLATSVSRDTAIHTWTIDSGAKKWAIDDVSGLFTSSGDTVASRSIFLFARHTASAVYANRPVDARLYFFKLYEGDQLVRDYIPVKFTNENGLPEGALYERLTKQMFRTMGLRSFIPGPEVVSSRGGTKCLTPRRSYRRLARPSARFCAHSHRWEVAA